MSEDPIAGRGTPRKPPLWFVLAIVAALAAVIALATLAFHDGG